MSVPPSEAEGDQVMTIHVKVAKGTWRDGFFFGIWRMELSNL